MENTTKKNLIHTIEEPQENSPILIKKFFLIIIGVIILGFFTGFIISKINSFKKGGTNFSDGPNLEKSVGIVDKKTFKDSAEGLLKEGGVDGEGNFHLERPGGESQNVYLTSSTVDLSKYINKKIKVWGETFKAQKAGWLMDVGLVEIE